MALTSLRVSLVVSLVSVAATAAAQDVVPAETSTETNTVAVPYEPPPTERSVVVVAPAVEVQPPPERHPVLFLEATGGYGFQFGETDYLNASSQSEYRHPLVHGLSVGGSVGVMLSENLAVFGNYEYTYAMSATGDVPGVVASSQGRIDYHTSVIGLRLYHPLGFGRLRAELGLGVLFPFATELEVTYGPALGALPSPITGTGSRIEHYSFGFGGQAAIGYEVPIVGGLYAALNLKFKLFQSENAGETTEYRNFVTEYSAVPPTATSAEVRHGDGADRPNTTSVQELRLHLALGYAF